MKRRETEAGFQRAVFRSRRWTCPGCGKPLRLGDFHVLVSGRRRRRWWGRKENDGRVCGVRQSGPDPGAKP